MVKCMPNPNATAQKRKADEFEAGNAPEEAGPLAKRVQIDPAADANNDGDASEPNSQAHSTSGSEGEEAAKTSQAQTININASNATVTLNGVKGNINLNISGGSAQINNSGNPVDPALPLQVTLLESTVRLLQSKVDRMSREIEALQDNERDQAPVRMITY
ncbi:hypothetical protein CF319_g515 [Tilletia indica]|nr:hypothetical protein CF319_g515 [Tilletia indica]